MSINIDIEKQAEQQARLAEEREKREEAVRRAIRKRKRVLPQKMDDIARTLIQETEVMNLTDKNAIEYVENVTNHRISLMRYYRLKRSVQLEDSTWLLNFARGGFIRFFRERMFVFTNLLQNISRQYQTELSTRAHENQDSDRLIKLGDQIIKVNTLLAQYGMSSPVLVAMKMANDPEYASIKDIVDEDEKNKLLLDYKNKFTKNTYKGKPQEKLSKKDTNFKNKQIDKLNKEIGFGIAERQTGIRLSRLYEDSKDEDSASGLAGGSGSGREDVGETTTEGTGLSEGEEEYRRQKDRAVF